MTESQGTYRIRLFAAAADIAGKTEVEIDSSEGVRILELEKKLVSVYPTLESLVKNSRWAVDLSFVSKESIVTPGQAIALIPPVSGG